MFGEILAGNVPAHLAIEVFKPDNPPVAQRITSALGAGVGTPGPPAFRRFELQLPAGSQVVHLETKLAIILVHHEVEKITHWRSPYERVVEKSFWFTNPLKKLLFS